MLGYIKHPFIVGLNMAFQTKDKLFFVLDYCAGGELFFHLGERAVCILLGAVWGWGWGCMVRRRN